MARPRQADAYRHVRLSLKGRKYFEGGKFASWMKQAIVAFKDLQNFIYLRILVESQTKSAQNSVGIWRMQFEISDVPLKYQKVFIIK